METIEIRTFIKTVGRRRFDHIRSRDIRRQYKVQEIGEWNEHLSRTARDNSPTGKSSPGRPHKSWKDSFWKKQASSLTQSGGGDDDT
jgi:hypothetical protein